MEATVKIARVAECKWRPVDLLQWYGVARTTAFELGGEPPILTREAGWGRPMPQLVPMQVPAFREAANAGRHYSFIKASGLYDWINLCRGSGFLGSLMVVRGTSPVGLRLCVSKTNLLLNLVQISNERQRRALDSGFVGALLAG